VSHPFHAGRAAYRSARSPGSWVSRFDLAGSAGLPRIASSGFDWPILPTYSGGTAPDSHRLPFYALLGQLNELLFGDGYLMPLPYPFGSTAVNVASRCGFPGTEVWRMLRTPSVARPPFSTIPEQRTPSVVIITPGPSLLAACREAARFVGATVEIADVKGAATSIAKSRPFAIVLDQDLLAFDPREFEALARDVGAEIVPATRGATEQALVTELLPSLKAVFKRWSVREDPFAG
jgi:hypothetical protein